MLDSLEVGFLQPALMAFFQQNYASLIYPEETDRIDSFGFLRQLRTDEAFEKLRRTVNKSKLLSSAKEMDNGLRIVNALNSRNAVAHHDLAKIFRIWPQMLASWTDLIEITLGNVQAAKKMQNIFYQLKSTSFNGTVNAASVKTVSAMLEATLQSYAIYTAIKLNEIQIECALIMRRQQIVSSSADASEHQHQLVTSFIDYENYLNLSNLYNNEEIILL